MKRAEPSLVLVLMTMCSTSILCSEYAVTAVPSAVERTTSLMIRGWLVV